MLFVQPPFPLFLSFLSLVFPVQPKQYSKIKYTIYNYITILALPSKKMSAATCSYLLPHFFSCQCFQSDCIFFSFLLCSLLCFLCLFESFDPWITTVRIIWKIIILLMNTVRGNTLGIWSAYQLRSEYELPPPFSAFVSWPCFVSQSISALPGFVCVCVCAWVGIIIMCVFVCRGQCALRRGCGVVSYHSAFSFSSSSRYENSLQDSKLYLQTKKKI